MGSVVVTLRISPELKEKLEKLAREDSRSLNNMVTIILQKYVAEHSGGD